MLIGNVFEIELRGFKLVPGHDDSLPYQASLYINGKRIATCFNDGWGGDTIITLTNRRQEQLLQMATQVVNQTKWFDDVYHTMATLVDVLAFEELQKQKRKKILNRYQDTRIVLERTGVFSTVKFIAKKGVTITDAMIAQPDIRIMLNHRKAKYINEGYQVLNTNF